MQKEVVVRCRQARSDQCGLSKGSRTSMQLTCGTVGLSSSVNLATMQVPRSLGRMCRACRRRWLCAAGRLDQTNLVVQKAAEHLFNLYVGQ